MDSVKLKLLHTFGSTCSKMYRNVLSVCDQDKNQPKIVFPAGKTLARKYLDRQQMDFVQFSQNTEHIECMSILPTKTHIAVAQKSIDSHLQVIKIYNMSKNEEPHVMKMFHDSDKVGIIKQIVFSASQPKFMCALIGQPHNKLIFVDSSRNKPLAQSNFILKDIQKITICPYNSHLICASGGSFIRIFKIQEYAFKPLQQIRKFPRNRIIKDHVWYKKKTMIVATDKSEILLIEQVKPSVYEVRQQYRNVFNQPNGQKFVVTAMCPFSKGIIIGSNNGKFCLWTKKQDLNNIDGEQKLQLTRKWSTSSQRMSQVTNITINLKQDLLAISMANNDIATLYLNDILPQISQLITQSGEKQIVFQYLYKGFHNQAITGMDICEQRPLIATCSTEDSTIRVWNYKNFGCKLLRMFYFKIKDQAESDKPLITLAFHPSGYYMAVGCVDKVRIFHVLNNQLRPYRQIGVKKANLVKFSHGGHLLAVCHPFKQDLQFDYIKVYNALTLQQLVCFKDNQSIVKSLQWKTHDEFLCSTYKNGTLKQWRVSDWSLNKSLNKKELQFQSSLYNTTNNSILVYGYQEKQKKNFLQQFGENNRNLQIDMKISKMLQIPLSKDKNCILLALENGSLVVFGGINKPIILDYQNHHISAATQLILSPCGKYVMTAGKDCLIFIYQLIFLNEQKVPIKTSQLTFSTAVDDFLADVVLINKKQIQSYNTKQKQHTKLISQLSKKLHILSEDGKKRHKQAVTQLEIQKNRIIQELSYRIQRIKQQIDQMKKKNQKQIQQFDGKNLTQIQQIQKNYEQKIQFQSEKYFQLQQQLIQLKVLHQKKLQKLHKEQEQMIKKLKNQFEAKFRQSQIVYSQTKKQAGDANEIFQKRLKQIQQEQEQELREIQAKRQKFKQQTTEILQQLHERLQKLKKQHANLQKQKLQLKSQNEELTFNKKKIQKEVIQVKQKHKDLLHDFDQKLESLNKKQSKIVQFQGKVTELQKKKHILSYKATQLKKAIEPKQFQIQKLKLDLIKLKKQFETSLQRKQKLNLNLQKINKQKQHQQRNLQEQKKCTKDQQNLIDQIISDIYVCIQRNRISKQKNQEIDFKIYYKELIKLYHKYVDTFYNSSKNSNPNLKNVDLSTKGVDDVTKHIVHLQKSLFQLNKSNEKNILRKNQEIFKRTKQNTELVNNLNQIKKQNKQLMLKIRSKNIQIQQLKSTKNELILKCGQNIDNVTMKLMKEQQINFNAIMNGNVLKKGHSKTRLSALKHKIEDGQKDQNLNNLDKKIINPSLNINNKKNSINYSSIQKKQCQIISQIEFINEKIHKFEFYLNDMKEKLRKHVNMAQCEEARRILIENDDQI